MKSETKEDPPDDPEIYLLCPHCGELFMTTEKTIACTIYRHAVLKSNMEQINPHSPKEECDRLIEQDLVYGCAKPFRVIKNENKEYIAIVCDYI
jgi:uncharacterized C2H2 Zn-finger protein